ncbi:hypothetical protein ACI2L1_11860 [Streptomyces sp. NPDC019531]|uniref:hypothetical protein n=1 Tax=Streptomyces sp. NPDC019531 TaxID=3365062 RepID=UPI00384EF2A7
MFRTLARLLADSGFDTNEFFRIHPLQLSRWVEQAWAEGGQADWPGFETSPAGVTPEVVARLQLPGEVNGGLLDDLRSGIAIPGQFSPAPAAGLDSGAACRGTT